MNSVIETEKPKGLEYRIGMAELLRKHMDLAFVLDDKDRVRKEVKWAEKQAQDDNISIDLLWMPEQAFQDRVKEGGI